jgi:hypothetical protein
MMLFSNIPKSLKTSFEAALNFDKKYKETFSNKHVCGWLCLLRHVFFNILKVSRLNRADITFKTLIFHSDEIANSRLSLFMFFFSSKTASARQRTNGIKLFTSVTYECS